jgi:hypothetical protein
VVANVDDIDLLASEINRIIDAIYIGFVAVEEIILHP